MNMHFVFVLVTFLTTCASAAALPDIPSLPWQERSDWINVKTDVAPPAVGDGVADEEDVCAGASDPGQEDLDGDGVGDACDDDKDGDGVANAADTCVSLKNPDQADLDTDGMGDACDDDLDGDGVGNDQDNCPGEENPDQKDVCSGTPQDQTEEELSADPAWEETTAAGGCRASPHGGTSGGATWWVGALLALAGLGAGRRRLKGPWCARR